MLKLSKKADYALTLITELAATNGTYVSIREISEKEELPYKFLSQIATDLKKANLVNSKEGIGGGYQLAKSPEDISLKEIINAIEGPIAPVACMRGESCHRMSICKHRKVLINLTEMINESLGRQSVADLLR